MASPIRTGLRLWDIVLLSVAIQIGMLPLLAQDFHRVSLVGPLSNIPAVLLTGLIVPFGFLALACNLRMDALRRAACEGARLFHGIAARNHRMV